MNQPVQPNLQWWTTVLKFISEFNTDDTRFVNIKKEASFLLKSLN